MVGLGVQTASLAESILESVPPILRFSKTVTLCPLFTNVKAAYDTIVNGGYDACIIATGGKPRTLDVNGLETGKVTYALNYLNGEVKFDGENALVIGGGITGAEVAVELAKEGKKVTIIEVMDQFLALPSAVIPAYQFFFISKTIYNNCLIMINII